MAFWSINPKIAGNKVPLCCCIVPPFNRASGISRKFETPGIAPVTSVFLSSIFLTCPNICPYVNVSDCAFKELIDKFSGTSYIPFPSTFLVAEYPDNFIWSPTASSFTNLTYLLVVPSTNV